MLEALGLDLGAAEIAMCGVCVLPALIYATAAVYLATRKPDAR